MALPGRTALGEVAVKHIGSWAILVMWLAVSGAFAAENTVYPEEFVLKPLKLLPPSLRLALDAHQPEILKSFREGVPGLSTDKDLLAALKSEMKSAIDGLMGQKPSLADLIAPLGRMAWIVARLGDPDRFHRESEAGWFTDFSLYRRKNVGRCVAVFYDHDPALFERGDIEAFQRSISARAADYAKRVAEAYRAGGNSSSFDDLSPAFGLVSLQYCHTVTDVANVWLFCWSEADGDMTGTPYYTYTEPAQPQKEPATAAGGTD